MDTYDRYAVLRNKKGYTDYKVCKLAKIPQSTLYSWKGKRYEPEIPTLAKIAVILDCSISDFFGDNTGYIRISGEWTENLENRFNHLVSLLGAVDISVMKEIVGISEMIEEVKIRCEKGGDVC